MSRTLCRGLAVATAFVMLASSAPAFATDTDEYDSRANAPVMVDVLILRPLGLLALGTGAAVFAAISPVMLIARPQELGKPFDALIAEPARYVWRDPLGTH